MSYDGNIIAHQVNCKGVMGAGLAKSIRSKFPIVYDQYMNHLKSDIYGVLGDMQPVEVYEGHFICNLYGQDTYGRTGVHTDYKALEKALTMLQDFAIARDIKEVALPYGIGAGLAGGDWNTIYAILERVFTDVSVVLYKL